MEAETDIRVWCEARSPPPRRAAAASRRRRDKKPPPWKKPPWKTLSPKTRARAGAAAVPPHAARRAIRHLQCGAAQPGAAAARRVCAVAEGRLQAVVRGPRLPTRARGRDAGAGGPWCAGGGGAAVAGGGRRGWGEGADSRPSGAGGGAADEAGRTGGRRLQGGRRGGRGALLSTILKSSFWERSFRLGFAARPSCTSPAAPGCVAFVKGRTSSQNFPAFQFSLSLVEAEENLSFLPSTLQQMAMRSAILRHLRVPLRQVWAHCRSGRNKPPPAPAFEKRPPRRRRRGSRCRANLRRALS